MTNHVGPNMFFILRLYQMTETELAEEIESDRDLMRQGFISQGKFLKRSRALARKLRQRDQPHIDEIPATH
jgi:hypothetical protein